MTITFDRYGHLMPGNEAEAAALLDRYLARDEGSVACGAMEKPGDCYVRDRGAEERPA